MSRGRIAAVALGLLALTVGAFSAVGSYPFVAYDDGVYVAANPHVASGLTAGSVRWALTATENSNWHPVSWLSHMLDVSWFGLDPGKHHAVSVALHAGNVVLLFLLLVRMTGAVWRSALAASLFAIHPLHVESVAWISERKDVLSTLFWFLTLAAWLSWLDSKTTSRYAVVLVLYILGLMAKPMLVTLPFALMLLDVWPLERATFPPLWREKVPLLAAAAASSIVTVIAQRSGGGLQTLESFTLSERIANAALAYAGYLGKMLWPTALSVFYPHPRLGTLSMTVMFSALVIVAITALAWRARHAYPFVLVGWLWYVGTLVPVIGLVQVGQQSMADRYTYIPLVGPFVAIAWSAGELASRSRVARLWTAAAASATLIVLLPLTRAQVAYWSGSEDLFQHALAVTTDNWMAHNNLGGLYAEEGRTSEAEAELGRALAIRPDFVEARYNLARTLAQAGKPDDAIATYREVIRAKPEYAPAHYNLANLLLHAGRLEEAIEEYGATLALAPDDANAHNNLAIALGRSGKPEEAIAHYREALRIKPDFEAARNNLARLGATP